MIEQWDDVSAYRRTVRRPAPTMGLVMGTGGGTAVVQNFRAATAFLARLSSTNQIKDLGCHLFRHLLAIAG